jgi:hypothetical protein
MHELAHEFTSRKVSPWGGIKYFHKTYLKTGLQEYLQSLNLPFPESNRGYNPVDLIEGFMTSVVLGSRRLEHSGMVRHDEVIKSTFGWDKGMASPSTFSRFFSKFTIDRNNEVFPSIMRYWYEQVPINNMTVDIDSSVITRYGKQELAEKGYNPQKPGRNSHHPLFAFCDELKMVINAWMRSGNSNSITQIDEFLEELFFIIPRNRIGLLRADSGFYSQDIFRQLESGESVSYIIRAKMTTRLMQDILELDEWHSNNDIEGGVNYSELLYEADGWDQYRRFVVVRKPRSDFDKSQSYLHKEDELLARYEYKAYVTNTPSSAVMVHGLYNRRADCENRIKELKYDYSIDGFSLHSFSAMESAFRFIMLAYNIMSLFRQKVLTSPKASMLSTIKFQCIAIGSYLVKDGRKIKMKLSAEGKRRHFLEHIFQNLEHFTTPIKISNA